MISRGVQWSVLLWVLALAACAERAPEPTPQLQQAALLTASCSGCHASGGSPDGIVTLDGMSAQQLEASLLGYRNDPAGGTAMHRMARGYTEAQIAAIAAALGQ